MSRGAAARSRSDCGAGQTAEDDDVVDARCQQHQQNTEQNSLIIGDESRESEHDDRNEDEVHAEQGDEESAVFQGLSDRGERHREECGVEQDDKNRVDRVFETRSGIGCEDSHEAAD